MGVAPGFSTGLPSGEERDGRDKSEEGDRMVGEGVSVFESFSVEDIAGVLMTAGGL